MNSDCKIKLNCVVVDWGLGTRVVRISKEVGITGFTAFLGEGTIQNHFLCLLGLDDIKKEIIFLLSDETLSERFLTLLNKKFRFERPNHGIAFSLPVANVLGASNCICSKEVESRGADDIMYDAIFTIVDKGMAETVVDTAVAVGSRGGTIINARGAGIHEYNKLLAMAIEPEKEIVMILSKKDLTDTIVQSIRKALNLDAPGNGLLFVLDIDKAYGLY